MSTATKKTAKKAAPKKVVAARTKSAPKKKGAKKAEVRQTVAEREGALKKGAKPDLSKRLAKAQERILAYLCKVGNRGANRKTISEQASADLAYCTSYLGSSDDEKRFRNDVLYFPSLLTRGYVKGAGHDDGGAVYVITPAGRKAIGK